MDDSRADLERILRYYHDLPVEPVGKYHILVCGGTGCHLKNMAAKEDLLRCILSHLGLSKAPDITKDGLFSVSESTHCLGACGVGPVMKINDTIYTKVTREKVTELLENLKLNH